MMMQPSVDRILPNDVELSNTIRSRWVDVARWLRGLIYSEMLNLGNRDAIERRLERTADEADLFYTLYYGPEIGNQVKTIYNNYYDYVKQMIKAYKEDNLADMEQHQRSMYSSADELAQILSRVNRYWDYATLQALFSVLVDNTEKQIENIVKGNYEEEIDSYDQYVEQTYRISDELTYGMIRQFRVPR